MQGGHAVPPQPAAPGTPLGANRVWTYSVPEGAYHPAPAPQGVNVPVLWPSAPQNSPQPCESVAPQPECNPPQDNTVSAPEAGFPPLDVAFPSISFPPMEFMVPETEFEFPTMEFTVPETEFELPTMEWPQSFGGADWARTFPTQGEVEGTAYEAMSGDSTQATPSPDSTLDELLRLMHELRTDMQELREDVRSLRRDVKELEPSEKVVRPGVLR
jgi:hypothetical protein